jgi:hypothetical protein
MMRAATSAVPSAQTYSRRTDNNFATHPGNNISAESAKVLAFSISQHDYTERVQRVMREFVGPHGDAPKRLANALGCAIGTAKNYLEGRTTPQGIHDKRAIAVIPGYLALTAELAGLEMALDPRHQRRLTEFMRYCAMEADAIFSKPDGDAG